MKDHLKLIKENDEVVGYHTGLATAELIEKKHHQWVRNKITEDIGQHQGKG